MSAPSQVVQGVRTYLDVLVEQRNRDGYNHETADYWRLAPDHDPFSVGAVFASRRSRTRLEIATAINDHAFATVSLGEDAVVDVRIHSRTPEAGREAMRYVRALLPPAPKVDESLVPVWYWTLGGTGPRCLRREIDADPWPALAANYPSKTRASVDQLMSEQFSPGVGGQLLLWHGEPGTGKTTALRALATAWRSWCQVQYVVDPERFLGSEAEYMMNVLMEDEYEAVEGFDSSEANRRHWRLLVLEDSGEMLQPDARREVGQALSRLLNACDGLIGRGLRFLVLVTTNEPLSRLHPAVGRPGRCAAQIEFERFDAADAVAWLEAHGAPDTPIDSATLAELYGVLHGAGSGTAVKRPTLGFA